MAEDTPKVGLDDDATTTATATTLTTATTQKIVEPSQQDLSQIFNMLTGDLPDQSKNMADMSGAEFGAMFNRSLQFAASNKHVPGFLRFQKY